MPGPTHKRCVDKTHTQHTTVAQKNNKRSGNKTGFVPLYIIEGGWERRCVLSIVNIFFFTQAIDACLPAFAYCDIILLLRFHLSWSVRHYHKFHLRITIYKAKTAKSDKRFSSLFYVTSLCC